MSKRLNAPPTLLRRRVRRAPEPQPRQGIISPGQQGHETTEEALVMDDRAGMRPAQLVERKLRSLLDGRSLSVSQLRTEPLSSRGRAPVD